MGGMNLIPPVKWANFSDTGTGEIVAAVAGKKIRILAVTFSSASAVALTLQDDAGTPNVLLGPFSDVTAGFALPYSEEGWQETASGQALDVVVGALVQSEVMVVYAEVD